SRGVVEQVDGTDGDGMVVDLRDDALAGDRFGFLDHFDGQSLVLRAADDRLSQGVLGGGFGTGGQGEHLIVRVGRVEDLDVGQLGAAVGQGAGLVDDHGVDLRGGLQVFATLDEHPVLSGASDTGDNRDRDGDDQRPRAGDDQQGQGQFHIEGDQANGEGGDHHTGGVVLREFLQERLGFCLVILGVFDAVDDLGQGGIRYDADSLNAQYTGAQPSSGEDLRVLGLLSGYGFPGDGGLIDPAVTGEHASIDGDLLAVFHEHDVTGGQFPDLNGFGLTVAQHGGGLGGSVHQVRQCLAGAVHR